MVWNNGANARFPSGFGSVGVHVVDDVETVPLGSHRFDDGLASRSVGA